MPKAAEVNYLNEQQGIVTVRSFATADNEKEAVLNAEKNAFNTLFFRGLPNSKNQKSALIGTDENSIKENNKAYFNTLFASRYKSFIMSSVQVAEGTKYKDGSTGIALDITINTRALKEDLENNNIIRKFGF